MPGGVAGVAGKVGGSFDVTVNVAVADVGMEFPRAIERDSRRPDHRGTLVVDRHTIGRSAFG